MEKSVQGQNCKTKSSVVLFSFVSEVARNCSYLLDVLSRWQYDSREPYITVLLSY